MLEKYRGYRKQVEKKANADPKRMIFFRGTPSALAYYQCEIHPAIRWRIRGTVQASSRDWYVHRLYLNAVDDLRVTLPIELPRIKST